MKWSEDVPMGVEMHSDVKYGTLRGRAMRLIDADALINSLKKDWPQTSKISWAQIVAKCAPTIRAEDLTGTCPLCGAKTERRTENDAK